MTSGEHADLSGVKRRAFRGALRHEGAGVEAGLKAGLD
jgi:hypothetical protein